MFFANNDTTAVRPIVSYNELLITIYGIYRELIKLRQLLAFAGQWSVTISISLGKLLHRSSASRDCSNSAVEGIKGS